MTARLVVEKLTKSVILGNGDKLLVVDEVSLAVDEGSSIAIVGRSGSGKTSLLSLLGLLSLPDSGRISLRGEDVIQASGSRRARLRNSYFGFIFQSYSLVPHLTAAENVELPLVYGELMSSSARRKVVAEMLAAVGLSQRAESRPMQLSGGEQQRVAIARAMARKPALILADEPTGALDTTTAEAVLKILYQATTERGASLIIVTHDYSVAALADRVLDMANGKLGSDSQSQQPRRFTS